MKLAKKILIWLIITIATVAIALSVAGYLMRDKIVSYITQEINKQLTTEIKVASIDFTLWKKFPHASIEFSKVSAENPKGFKAFNDTLFHFDKVFLSFNLEDIYNEKYIVRSIELQNGKASLHTNKKLISNYIFWKTDKNDTTSSGKFAVALEKVSLKNVQLDWLHEKRKEKISVQFPKVIAKGKFSDIEHSTALYGETIIKRLEFDNTSYLKGEKINLDIGFEVNQQTNAFQISRGLFTLRKKYDFDIKGKFNENNYQIDIAGNNLDINAIKQLVPQKHLKAIKDYEGKGKINFTGSILKPLKSSRLKIDTQFEIKNSQIKHKKSGYTIENLSLKGSYSNGKKMSPWTSTLEIRDLKAVLKSGNIKGNLKLFNFKRPRVKLHVDAQYAVEDFLKFFPSDKIESATGKVEFTSDFSGVIQNPDTITPKDFIKAKVAGHLKINDLEFKLRKNKLNYQNFQADLHLKNNGVTVKEITGNIADTDLKLKGEFINFLPWIFYDRETLVVNAWLESKNANLDQLLSGSEEESNREPFQLHLPANIKSNIQFKLQQFHLKKLHASNISGRLTSAYKTLSLTKVTLDAVDGQVKGNLTMKENSDQTFRILSTGQLSAIDIQQLFVIFNDFGQKSIQSHHIKGKADCKYTLRSTMKQDLHIDLNTLNIVSDLTINNGELIGYKPLMNITKDFDKNKILRLFIKLDDFKKRLGHIRFQELHNTFEIRNKTLLIPEMKIASSALDINVAGQHSFDNEIDYLMDFNLKDVLRKRGNVKKTEYGYIKDDGTGNTMIFLKITGTVDHPEISFNKKASAKRRKEIINREISTTKQILKEEFNISNESNKRNERPIKEQEFELDLGEFEEDEKESKTKNPKPAVKDTTKKKGIKNWLKKVTKEPKEEKSKFEEWEFEDDDF